MIPSASRLCLAVLAIVALAASAGSNLEGGLYPQPRCGAVPQAPGRPEAFRTEKELATYNRAVERYNADMGAYVGCVQRYVDDAAADIRLIRERIEHAIREVNE